MLVQIQTKKNKIRSHPKRRRSSPGKPKTSWRWVSESEHYLQVLNQLSLRNESYCYFQVFHISWVVYICSFHFKSLFEGIIPSANGKGYVNITNIY